STSSYCKRDRLPGPVGTKPKVRLLPSDEARKAESCTLAGKWAYHNRRAGSGVQLASGVAFGDRYLEQSAAGHQNGPSAPPGLSIGPDHTRHLVRSDDDLHRLRRQGPEGLARDVGQQVAKGVDEDH